MFGRGPLQMIQSSPTTLTALDRVNCPGPRPARFEISPHMEVPLTFWATCCCVWLLPQQNVLFLCSGWISQGLICAHCLCPGTEHCWKEPGCSSSLAPLGIYTLWWDTPEPFVLQAEQAQPFFANAERKKKEFVEEEWSEITNFFKITYI